MKIDISAYNQDEFDRGRHPVIILLWWLVRSTIFKGSLQSMYGYRNFLLRLFGARIGKGVLIRASVKINYPWKLSVGDYSWIGEHAEIYALDRITIGSNCVVSQYAHLCTGNHDMESKSFDLLVKPIVIKDYVWVATDAFVGQGVTLYEGSVVAARSSVYKDTSPWMVYMGNPGVAVKKRIIK